MLSAAHTSAAGPPDPFCLSPEYLYRDDLCAVRLPDVHSQKMVRHAGSLLFRRQSGCSQSRLYLRDIPLLYLVIRYIAPYIIRLHYENKKTLLLFFLLPLSYYILEYTLTVYTDLLYTGGPVIIDFMDSFLVLFFFILAMVSLDFSNKKSTAERENLLLTTAAAQA